MTARESEAPSRAEVLFVDPGVADAAVLLAGLRDGVEVAHLPARGDALAGIALALAGRRDVAAIHVLSHGAPGALRLSGADVDLAAIAGRPALVEAIRASLAADAEIVLYGCSVAEGALGAAFVDGLSTLIGRPVSASSRPVGAESLGGDWAIAARGGLAFDGAARAAFPGLLNQVFTFGGVASLTSASLTATEGGVTIVVTRSDAGDLQTVTGNDGPAVATPGTIAQTVSYTVTFSQTVNVSGFTIVRYQDPTDDQTYLFTPTGTGTTISVSDTLGSLTDDNVDTVNSSGNWTGITAFTVSYPHAGTQAWRLGVDSIVFTVAGTATLSPADLQAASDSGISNTDNITNAATQVLTGSATTDDIVQILVGGTTTAAVTATGGAWTANMSLSPGTHHITVQAISGGVTGAPSSTLTVVVDQTAPTTQALPDLQTASDTGISTADDITNAATQVISGTGTAGDIVSVLVGGATTALATVSGGTWSVNLSLSAGTHYVTALATDTAGNAGAASGTLTVVVDQTAPGTAGTPDLIATNDSGSSSTDNLTNNSLPTFAGSGAAAGGLVQVLIGGATVGNVTAQAGGVWTFTATATLAAGSNLVTVLAQDVAGNTGPSSTALTVQVDTTAPTLATPDLVAASDSGSSNTDNITNDSTPTFSGGGAETLATISILSNGSTVGTTTATTLGGWSFTFATTLSADGTYAITALQTDAAGNVSGASGALNIVLDATVPGTLGAPDLEAASDLGISNTDNITSATTQTVSGTGTTGDVVSVLVGGTTSALATVQGGTWAAALSLAAGTHHVTALATDTAGNAGGASATLTIVVDTVAPGAAGAPDLVTGSDSGTNTGDNLTNVSLPTFAGTGAVAGGLVQILLGGATIGTATAQAGGVWTFTSATTFAAGSNTVTVVAQDIAGNSAAASTALNVVIDTTAASLTAPDLAAGSDTGLSSTDNITSDSTPTFEGGGAETLATISVLSNGTTVGTTTATTLGNWSFTFSSTLTADGTYAITALQTDAAGNVGAASTALNVVLDTTAPGTLGTPDLLDASDLGVSNSDNITSSTTQTLGGSAATGSVVSVLVGGTTTLLVTATGGSWTGSLSLAEGSYAITALETDAVGNTGAVSTALGIVVDTTGPGGAGAPDLLDSSDTGTNTADNITQNRTPTFAGTGAQQGATVQILVDGATVGSTTAQTLGVWTFTLTATLTEGSHGISVVAQDVAGNSAAPSASLGIVIDTTATTLNPADLLASSDTGSSNTDNITTVGNPTITGTGADSQATVVILDDGATVGSTTANSLGQWTFTFTTSLASGTNVITVTQVDGAGNISTASAGLNVVIDNTIATASPADLSAASDLGISSTDNITSATTQTFTGTGTSGDVVSVLVGGTTLAIATVQGGTWAASLSLAAGTYNVTTVVTDLAGNSSAPSSTLSVIVDQTAPGTAGTPDLAAASDSGSSSTDNLTNNTTPILSGTGVEAGGIVQVLVGGVTAGSFTATGTTWTFALTSTLTAGSSTVTVLAQDVAGNSGPASTALNVVIDTSAASLTAPDLAAASDTGVSSTDNITSDSTPTFEGGGAETLATISVLSNGTTVGTTTATTLGNWSFTFSATLADGSYAITALQTDAAGNTGAASTALGIVIDTTAPGTAGTPDLIAATDLGVSSTDNITSSATQTFTGSASNGSIVSLLVGGTTTAIVTATGGSWTASLSLAAGSYAITAVETDAINNTGPTSTILGVNVDQTAPGTAGTPDLVAGSDSGSSNTDNLTNAALPTFSGTGAVANSLVQVLVGGVTVGRVTASGTGTWTFTSATTFTAGTNAVTAITQDVAGNDGPASAALNVVLDTTVSTLTTPDLATASDTGSNTTDNVTGDSTPTFEGSGAETLATIAVLSNGTTVGTTTATTLGNWSFTFSSTLAADGTYAITAIQTDAAGNASGASAGLNIVLDATAPGTLGTPDLSAVSDTGVSSTDNITNAATQTFTGSATTNSVVSVLVGGTTAAIVTATGGSWTSSLSLAAGSYAITALEFDAAGNTGVASTALGIVVDQSAPGSSGPADLLATSDTGTSTTDDLTSDTTPSFSGVAATPNAQVHILINTVTVGSVTAGTGGTWAYTASTLTAGTQTIQVVGDDLAGNNSLASSALSVLIDTSAATLGAPDLAAASDTGLSSTDNITGDSTPTFEGSGAETLATISVLSNGTTVGTTTATTLGNWSFTFSATLADGTYAITAIQTDVAGNSSAASAALNVTIDTTAPGTAGTPDLVAATDLGVSSTDNITSSATQTFTGSASNGSVVTLLVGGSTTAIVTATGGSWTTSLSLAAGSYAITAVETDALNNTGPVSTALGVLIDQTAPGTTGTPDLVAGSDSGSSNTDNLTNAALPTFSGTGAVANSLVQVLVGGVTVGRVTASGTGTWTFTSATTFTAGTNAVTAITQDVAGNAGPASAALNVVLDATVSTLATPDLATASDTGSNTTDNITGDSTPTFEGGGAETLATVAVLSNGTTVGTTTATTLGNWSFTFSSTLAADGTYAITAIQTDAAGNASGASAALNIVLDTTAPGTLGTPDLTATTDLGVSSTDNITNSATQTFTGSATTNSVVSVLVGGTTAAIVTATGGSWTSSLSLTAGSYAVTAQEIDAAGNTGAVSTALGIVVDQTTPTVAGAPTLVAGSDTGNSTSDAITSTVLPTLSGASAQNNALVHVLVGGVTAGSVTASGTGTWTFTLTSTLAAGTQTITAVTEDVAGNEAAASAALNVLIDTSAGTLGVPDLAAASDTGLSSTDNITGDNTPTFEGGGAETLATIAVLSNGTTVGTTTATTLGNWSFTFSATLADGSFAITAIQTDVAGNSSAASAALNVVIDTTAPGTLGTPDLLAASDLGVSSTDDITSAATQTFSGSASTGDRVQVLVGGTTTAIATATGGSWTAALSLSAGTHHVTVAAIDALGRTGAPSTTLTVVVDQTPPASAGPADLLASSDFGTSNTDNLTNTVVPTFSGSGAQNNALVHILVGGTTVGTTTANASGAWTFTITGSLTAGTNTVNVVAEDIAGNDAAASSALSVVVDVTAATLAVDLATASDTGTSTTDNITGDSTPTFEGGAETLATIVLLSNGTTVGTTTATTLGGWSFTLSSTLADGSYAITATQTDQAGNTSAASAALNIVVDTTAPGTPAPADLIATSDLGVSSTDNITSAANQTISGSAANGDRIHVVVGGNTVTTVTATGNSWSATLSLTAGSYAITVGVTDAIGNSAATLSSALGIQVDLTAPTATAGPPDMLASSDFGTSNTDNITNTVVPTFSGTGAIANTLVHILVGGTTVGTTTASAAGAWTFTTTSSLTAGTHTITVRSEDIAGNDGPASAGLNIVVDTSAPAAPGTLATPDLIAASDTGTSNTDNNTTDTTPTFIGTNTSGATVHALLANGVTVGTFTSAAGGTYNVTASSLAAGSYAMTIREIDVAGNASTDSPALNIVIAAESSGSSGGGSSGGGDSGSGTTTTTPTTTTPPATTTTTTTTTTNSSGQTVTTQSQTVANTSTTESQSAAIVENTNNNGNVVTATLPPSTSISSEGPSTAQTTTDALTTLVTAVDSRDADDETDLIGGAQTFLTNLAATTTLDVRTIIPTSTSSSLSSPIVITGTSASEGSTQSEAFVIDLRTINSTSGSVNLQLDNIEFASVMGQSTITGGSGDNYVTADGSTQFITLGEGNDTLYGGSGNDVIGSTTGNDIVYGQSGDDSVFGGEGNDTGVGGTGTDVVYGNQQNDVVYGNQANDTIYGGQDNDTAFGGQDSDLIYGNLGQDSLSGQLGADTIYGGQGDDLVYGGDGNDVLAGNRQNDILSGGAGDDTMYGGDDFDVLYGGVGDDNLDGGAGDDTLYGGAAGGTNAIDVLGGGDGNDALYGGEGVDWIYSGSGSDAIYIEASSGFDVLADFDSAAGDVIHIASNVNGSGIASFADIQAAASNNSDGDVEIALGNNNFVRIIGVTSSQLTSDMFQFF